MGTPANIILKSENEYIGIICNYDGFPTGHGSVGSILKEHYTDETKIRELLALGDISQLGERVSPIGEHTFDKREEGTTTAYGRDRGEFEGTRQVRFPTLKEIVYHLYGEYTYVFENGAWHLVQYCSEEPQSSAL